MLLDWTALGWEGSSYASFLGRLPAPLQEQLAAHLPAPAAAALTTPAPWDMSAGSTEELLSELGLSALYGETLSEYGLERLHQLTSGGRDAMESTLRDLGVTRDHRDKLIRLAFSARPCGSMGGAFSLPFLAACRPAHAAAMGAENVGHLLYSLLRFMKPRNVVEIGAGYTTLWLLQATPLPLSPYTPFPALIPPPRNLELPPAPDQWRFSWQRVFSARRIGLRALRGAFRPPRDGFYCATPSVGKGEYSSATNLSHPKRRVLFWGGGGGGDLFFPFTRHSGYYRRCVTTTTS